MRKRTSPGLEALPVWPDAQDPDDLKDAVQRAKLRFKANTNQDPPDFEGQIAASRAAL